MGDFKINEKTVFTQSGSAEPAMGSTITDIPSAGLTGTIPSGVSLASATFPAGHILQVLSTTLTTGYSVAETSWTPITGLAVAITPNFSNSKVLVLVNMCITASNDHHARIVRGSTPIAVGTGQGDSQISNTFGYMYNSGGAFVETRSMNFLDSPATTSATTYIVQAQGSGSVYVNRASGDTDAANYGRQVSTITVMEVAQ